MIVRIKRLMVGGVIATMVDVGIFSALVFAFGFPILGADAMALAVAGLFSFWFHRVLTFPGDARVRWMERPLAVVTTMVIGAAVDLAVLGVLSWSFGGGDVATLVAKLAAVGVAALVRLTLYRRSLFWMVRDDIDNRVDRPALEGGPRLSVVVPAYREQDRIAAALTQLRAALADVDDAGGVELIVVDDGSNDGTADAARSAGADRVIVLDSNRGKGAAVRAGVRAAGGRTVVFTDADLAYRPIEVVKLLEAVEAGWDVAVGSRQHTDTTTLVRAGRLREVGGRAVNLLTHLVLLGQHRDTQCGIKAFRRDAAEVIFARSRVDRFAFDVELFHLVERYRMSLIELPVTVANSARSSVRVVPATVGLVIDLFRIRIWARQGIYDLDDAERGRWSRSDEAGQDATVQRHG